MLPTPIFIIVLIVGGFIAIVQLANMINIKSNSDRATINAYAAKKLLNDGYPINVYTEKLNIILGTIIIQKSLQEIHDILTIHLKTNEFLKVIDISPVVNEQLFLITTFPSEKSYLGRSERIYVPYIYSGLARLEKPTVHELLIYGEMPENSKHDALFEEFRTTIQNILGV